MVVLVNYATGKYKKTQHFNSWTGKYIAGFDKVLEYDDSFLDVEFKKKNKELLDSKKYRGSGCYIWKPYCILKALNEIQNGDILFYCDSGTFFCRRMKKIFEEMQEDIWVSNIPFIEKQFSKRMAFVLLGCDLPEYKETNQIQSGFIGIRKTDKTVKFIEKWLEYCENKELINPDNDDRYGTNDPCFIANREDQTILSLMCKKAGIKAHPDPTQYGKQPEEYNRDSRYIMKNPKHDERQKVYIILHRTGNVDLKICVKQILVAVLPASISLKVLKIIRREKG